MDQARRMRILRQHVRTDQLLGADAVPLGKARPAAVAAEPVVAQPSPTPAAPTRSSVAAPKPAPVAASSSDPLNLALSGDKIVALRQLDEQHVRGCTRCQLHAGRTQTVFGEGNPHAELMFIGEGPGQTEDETGRPFVGRAGELLDRMIVAMGLQRSEVFIANIVKCRPPENRAPTPAEVDACSRFLVEQIRLIRPRALVTLGGPATKFILQTDRGITTLRGTWHHWQGLGPAEPPIPVMPTFHPAYVLRNYTPETRGKVWSDLQKVMDLLKGNATA